MEPLSNQVRDFPKRVMAMPAGTRMMLIGGVVMVVLAVAIFSMVSTSVDKYQYAFTNLTTEDSSEAASTLKAANIPFRLEANGAALAVPASKVYDARLLLAAAGVPRGAGVGFELFDKGDIGVSEFTQRVNLRRATEGELARTISRLSEVRSARVHITLGEKGLFRDEERRASAAVVLNLQPGRTIGEKQLAGIRHLVASAIPNLPHEQVTIVDGEGTVLTAADEKGGGAQASREIEQNLENRVVTLLEPVVGRGAVVTRVTANIDSSEVQTQAETYDPDSQATRSERKTVNTQAQASNSGQAGVAGAAANQPLNAAPNNGSNGTSTNNNQNLQEEVHNYEISKTVTNSVTRAPRVKSLSVAVLLDGKDGKPIEESEVRRLGELAKRAVGFDEKRGDTFDISSKVFTRATDEGVAAAPQAASNFKTYAIAGGVIAALLLVVMFMALGKRNNVSAEFAAEQALFRPGARVAEIEASMSPGGGQAQLVDPNLMVQNRARELAKGEPGKTAHLVRAWIAQDQEGA